MKKCSRCKKEKELKFFSKGHRTKDGLHSYCKPCATESAKISRSKNPEKYRVFMKQYREENREKLSLANRDAKLKRAYGIGVDEYENILSKQGGVCALCGRDDSGYKLSKFFQVDHDHATGEIRGLLCSLCNLGLGSFNDSIEKMQAAVRYIRNSRRKPTVHVSLYKEEENYACLY